MKLSFLADLYQRRGGIKLGLGRIADAYPLVKRREIPAYHVAGTNGKGTTVYAIDHLLRRKGYRTGCFVSPHIRDFNERILVDGAKISDDAVARIYHDLEREIPDFAALSFFEVTFLMAWRWWEEEGIERAVIEVGLGGRLDATNVLDWPKTAIITSIGHDHTHILGDTVEQIASEKLGGVHAGDRLILGATIPANLAAWMREEAQRRGAVEVVTAPARPPEPFAAPPNLPLSPEQTANLAIAHTAVTTNEGPRTADFSELRLPGRFQRFRERIVLDVAHNPPAMEALARHLATLHMRPNLLFGAMRDKDITRTLAAIAPVVSDIFPVHLTADGDRGATVEEIVARAPETVRPKMKWHASSDETIAAALGTLAAPDAMLLVSGSFFMVERFFRVIETPEGKRLVADLHLPPDDLE